MYKRKAVNLKKRNGQNKLENKHSELKIETSDKSRPSKEDGITNDDKSNDLPRGTITPKQCTPKRKTSSSRSESPVTPLCSPVLQPMFPRTFNSPEIEVTWDWGCSQVPNDMLPPKRTKRTPVQTSPFFLQPINTIYTRRPVPKQLSEEENQKRLEFYRSILSMPPKDESNENSTGSTNNNIVKETSLESPTTTTPKRFTSALRDSGKKSEQTNFFDDSANEFMLECSQAIEEQLKNGEIELGSMVSIKLPAQKHSNNPLIEERNSYNNTPNDKLKSNLFPEKTGGKRRISLKSPINKRLKSDPNESSLKKFVSCDDQEPENENNNVYLDHPKSTEVFSSDTRHLNNNMHTDCKLSSGPDNRVGHTMINFKKCHNDVNQQFVEHCSESVTKVHDTRPPQTRYVQSFNIDGVNVKYGCSTTLQANNNISSVKHSLQRSLPIQNNTARIPMKMCNYSGSDKSFNNIKDKKSKADDINSLLDDSLDGELSRLDFDSICLSRNSQDQEQTSGNSMEAPTQPNVTTQAKVCSQKEIEAKRLAALNRLMMKKQKR